MHRPGIEPGAKPWKGFMLPVHHRCALLPGFRLSKRIAGPILQYLFVFKLFFR